MEKRLTKSQFMTSLSEKWGVSKKEAEEYYMQLVDLIYGEIGRAGEIMLPGMGRNPATGESIQIAAKTVLKFSVNKAAKDALL
jgi:DNA-binding protein HU-beta